MFEAYVEDQVRELYPWQIDCLRSEGVLEGKNLIYSAPTRGGKTLGGWRVEFEFQERWN